MLPLGVGREVGNRCLDGGHEMRCVNCSSGNEEANFDIFSVGCNASCCIAHVGHSIENIFYYNIYIICEVTIYVVHQTLISNQTFATIPRVEEARTNSRLQPATKRKQQQQKVTSNKKHCYYLKSLDIGFLVYARGVLTSHLVDPVPNVDFLDHLSSHAKSQDDKKKRVLQSNEKVFVFTSWR